MATARKDGTNVIEKVLRGCAIIENWQDVGRRVKAKACSTTSAATKQWKQVWVTDAGPMKEKKLIEEFKGGAVRFQGEIPHRDGSSHLDRTTLTPSARRPRTAGDRDLNRRRKNLEDRLRRRIPAAEAIAAIYLVAVSTACCNSPINGVSPFCRPARPIALQR